MRISFKVCSSCRTLLRTFIHTVRICLSSGNCFYENAIYHSSGARFLHVFLLSTQTQIKESKQKNNPENSCTLPCVISFTIRLSVSDEASAGLVQVLAALCTLEAGCVPFQVRGDSQDVLVVYLTSTAHTHRESRLLCVRSGMH